MSKDYWEVANVVGLATEYTEILSFFPPAPNVICLANHAGSENSVISVAKKV